MIEDNEPVPLIVEAIRDYTVFKMTISPFVNVGYLAEVKLTPTGWTAKLRMPVLPKKEAEQEKS